MTCKITMTLISESQEGNIGEDWKYELRATVVGEGLKGGATVSVPKHNLPSGVVREPHGAPAPVDVYEGECSGELLLRLHLVATEVDLFVDDVGKADKDLRFECSGLAGDVVTKEVDIPVEVREMPGIIPKTAIFTLRIRCALACN